MNEIENSDSYKECPENVRSTLSDLKDAFNKFLSVETIREELNINSDSEDWWYSYVRVVKCGPIETQKLNEKYINFLIEENYIDDIENKIVARFESGDANDI